MDKVLFALKPHSVVDVITNSSSELFVGNSTSKEDIINIIKESYLNYLDEYSEVKATKELSNDEIETYIGYHYNNWSNAHQKFMQELVPGFKYEDIFDGEYVKSNLVNNKNRDKFIKGIDPNNEMYFLFSLDDNPNWDYQEKLMNIMHRYHLG